MVTPWKSLILRLEEEASKPVEDGGRRDVVGMSSPVNEPFVGATGVDSLTRL
jgi:hypothetical protein